MNAAMRGVRRNGAEPLLCDWWVWGALPTFHCQLVNAHTELHYKLTNLNVSIVTLSFDIFKRKGQKVWARRREEEFERTNRIAALPPIFSTMHCNPSIPV